MSDNEDEISPVAPVRETRRDDDDVQDDVSSVLKKMDDSRDESQDNVVDGADGSGNESDGSEHNAEEDDGADDDEGDGGDDGEEDDDEPVRKSSSKLKRKRSDKPKKKSSKRRGASGFRLFNDEAEEGDEQDEDEDYDQAGGEQILDRDELAAIAAVEKRHKANREYLDRSAEEIAADFERRAQQEKRIRANFEAGEGIVGATGSVQQTLLEQQSLLPSVMDPKIFKLKCKPGNEMLLVRSVMLKAIDMRNKGGLLKIKSAFCSGVKGLIYVEALSEAFAKEVIMGLRMIYGSSFSQVPVGEMTSVLSATVKVKPIKEGQWVRLKRGPLKGDLARIVGLFEGGSKALIQAVPRPDYSGAANTQRETKQKVSIGGLKVRPQQRLFDAEEARLAGSSFVSRRHHPLDNMGGMYDVWENEYYKDGFLFKEVTVATYLDTLDVKPRLEELLLFRQRKAGEDREDDEDLDEEQEKTEEPNANFLKELADQIDTLGEEETKEGVNALLPGDLVQVTSGDMRHLIARVVSVNDATRVARVMPYNHSLTTEMSVEVDLLVKHIFPGAHVKVVAGRYMGQTGQVVSVYQKDGINVAAILTDGINTEIHCNVSYLQMSSEVTTGFGNLMGYELYDIVALSENECAVVIVVGTEKLRVINHMGNVRDVLPQELLGKRNTFSARSTGFDVQQNVINIGDTVKVTTGFHAKLTGTVKQMMKGTLWLHSNSYLKNSGIFVVKTRNCVVAGGKTATPALSKGYKGVLLPAAQNPAASGTMAIGGVTAVGAGAMARGGSNSGPRGGGGRDYMIGKTVRITKGGYKGLLAQVVDATPTHYSVELLAKLKKIVVERANTVFVGDEKGSLEKATRRGPSGLPGDVGVFDISQTPYFTQDTPVHGMGSETPRFVLGSETPMVLGDATPSSRTPRHGGDGSDAIWTVNDMDREQRDHSTSTSMQNSPGHSMYSDSTSRRGGSGWGSGPASVSSFAPSGTDNSAYSAARYSQASGMSSMMHSGSATPMSMMGEAGSLRSGAGSSVSGSTAGAEVTFRDWTEDMVVVPQRGQETGKLAVIQQRADDNGNVQLSLRDKHGGLTGGFSLHYTDLSLAPPQKNERAIVLTGKDRGKTGFVSSVQRSDVFMVLDGRPNDPQMYRAKSVAWLNSRR